MSTKIPKELAIARFIAATKRPYLALALFALTPIERIGLKTMACDERYRLYYDPISFKEWTKEQIAAVLIHEVSHLLRRHHLRCQKLNANSQLWNLASDAEINDDLLDEGLDLPGNPITPASLNIGLGNGRLAEEYYNVLKQHFTKSQKDQPFQKEFHQLASKCGSCATGKKEDYEADEVEAPGLNSIEQLALEEKVAKHILKASQTRGKIAGGWQRWANEKLNPKADWRKQLNNLIGASLRMTTGANDYSYSRPNRRQSVYGNIVMPSLVKPIPNISVIVDTSGSLNDQMMSRALAEVETILKRNGQRLHLISCDSRVHFSKQISSIKEAKLIGGGGTDLRVGIKQALEIKPKPDVIIVITDGDTPWPREQPKHTKVIAALTRPNKVPNWIKQVKLFD